MKKDKQKQLRGASAPDTSVMSRLTMVFDGAPLTTYVFRGRPCTISQDLGAALGYDDGGFRKNLDDWSSELIAGKDVQVLRGAELREFKTLFDASVRSTLGRASQLTILYESGFDLVCTLTRKPVGRKLRRFLADEVLPKLRRGESFGGDEVEVPAPLLRDLFRDDAGGYDAMWKDEIVRELCRTFRVQQTQAFPAPLMGVVGKVYRMRLGGDAHDELKRLNPRGRDRDMHYQRFSERLHERFGDDMRALKTLLMMSRSKEQFWNLWQLYCTGEGQLMLGW